MKTKTLNILYWVVTIIFGLAMIADGIAGFFETPEGVEAMQTLGYPMYLMMIVGTAKILGGIAVLQNKWITIKEWAFAGFTICFIGASASWAFSGGAALFIAFPLIFLAVMFLNYGLWKKREGERLANPAKML